MPTPPDKKNTLIINGRKREKFTWPNGRTLLKQYDAADRLSEETHNSGKLTIIIGWQSNGWRSERYQWDGHGINRREYEARRPEYPDMPASQGYPGLDDDDVMSISYQEATGYRQEWFCSPDGSGRMRLYISGDELLRAWDESVTASGRRITENRQPPQLIRKEVQTHPESDQEQLAIASEYKNDVLISQHYLIKGNPVTRAAYEQARQEYPDMPPADDSVADEQAEIAQMNKAARVWARQDRRKAMQKHQPNAERARQEEAYCESLIAGGEQADAWIAKPRNTISVRSRRASVAFIRKLYSLGAEQVYVCDIEDGGGAGDNSSHLVVRLPATGPARVPLLAVASAISQREGFDPVLDDGQCLQYLKMD